ncbi:GAF domain-containing protein [Syntrophomonas palmitatica]|uniref:GAF domain-containing protein n=1 Tax=Syntrophomonas palmitatica TaxID=402877 RepID=UPI0006D046C1|nr:GAF domain-containing protein [Syntrophomonas palmitatica]
MAKEMMQPAMESERELGWELRKFQILYEMAISMSAGQTLDMTLQLIVNKTREILQTDTAFIFLCDNQRKELYAHSFCGVLTGSMNNMRFAYNKSLGGESIASGKVAALENYFSCPDIEPEIKELVAKEGLVSMMAVPISINSQELGVLYVANRYVKAFDREEIDTFILIANLAAVEIQRRKAEESLRHSQRHLADIINFLPDPTLVINDEGVVISWNKAMEEMTGVPASDMLGKGDYEYAIPFYGEKRPILADLMLESDDEIQKTYSIVHRDGNTLVAETSLPCVHGIPKVLWGKATLLYDTQGRKIGL